MVTGCQIDTLLSFSLYVCSVQEPSDLEIIDIEDEPISVSMNV